MSNDWLDQIKWTDDGLVPVIAQETGSGKVLMMAWMNRESLAMTADLGRMVYWSRSRNKLWAKGEESGHVQKLIQLRLDCDQDVVLAEVEQIGGIACHTGRHNCFYQRLDGDQWTEVDAVIKDPKAIYG